MSRKSIIFKETQLSALIPIALILFKLLCRNCDARTRRACDLNSYQLGAVRALMHVSMTTLDLTCFFIGLSEMEFYFYT